MRKAGRLIVIWALAGCGASSSGGQAPGTGGASGAVGPIGSGGSIGASGTPSGGSPPVAGTSSSGTGLAGAPGTAGDAAAGAAVAQCEAADSTVTGSAAHAAALGVLNQMVPCGLSICHAGMGQAKLVLLGVTDLKATLVGKPACEAPALMLVDGQGGNAALTNSWLWQKLTAPAMSTDALVPQAAWGTPASCPTMNFGPTMTSGFGDRMPYGSLATLESTSLAKIRNWICAGAPGP